MLQSMRENMKGWAGGIIVGFLVLVMASFGLDTIFSGGAQGNEVANVNGEAITELDLNRGIATRKNQLRAQFGDNFPEDLFSDETLREPVLNELIKVEVMSQVAQENGLAAAERRVDEMIIAEPAFQVDGKFNQDQFRMLVGQSGYTPQRFRERLAQDYILNQQASGIISSGFVTDKDLEATVKLSQQKRDFYYLTIPLAPIEETIEVTDEEIAAHYESNKSAYTKPEEVTIQYIELNLSDIESKLVVTEDELRDQYEQERAAFIASTERQAAHILIEPKDDGSATTLAADLKQQLDDGADFAALANEYSDDFGSKEQGGDLGYTTGDTFPEEFETALAQLEVGEVSAPVETDAGIHLIKLLDVRGSEAPTFEEDRGRIERAVKRARAESEYLELSQQLEDITYNASDLTEAANILGVSVKNAGPFSRSGGFGIASDPKVASAAFSDDVLLAGNTSTPIETGPNQKVVLRVTDHQPSRIMELDEVKETVAAEVKREKAAEKLLARAAEIKQEIAAGEEVETIARENDYEWQVSQNTLRTDPQVRRDILSQVFELERPTDSPVVSEVELNNGDYAVVSLTKVEDGSLSGLSTAEKENLKQRMSRLWGEATYIAYETALVSNADVER